MKSGILILRVVKIIIMKNMPTMVRQVIRNSLKRKTQTVICVRLFKLIHHELETKKNKTLIIKIKPI